MNYIDHYKKDAEIFDYFEERKCKATEHDERRLREYILSLIPKNSELILDAGSGSGWAAEKLIKKNRKVVSMDLSHTNVSRISKNIESGSHFGIAGDGLRPPFKKNTFDCITASEVIEHVINPEGLAKSLFNILKPGGKLIISTPYKEKIQYYMCVHCSKPTPKNAHLHSFDEKRLTNLIKKRNLISSKVHIFGNKALHLLRTYIILSPLPFQLWRQADMAANMILPKQEHIIVEFIKEYE